MRHLNKDHFWININSFFAPLFNFILVSLFLVGCKSLADVKAPPTSLNVSNVYSNDAAAIAVVTGIYEQMSTGSFATGSGSISLEAGLSSDELSLWSGVTDPTILAQYQNALSVSLQPSFFDNIYNFIYLINDAIEGISNSKTLTPAIQKQLLGEVDFLRGFLYFYLVNMYGDVPLVLSTSYKTNSLLARSSQVLVWKQIIVDLANAQGLLSNSFLDGTIVNNTIERVRPTKWAASALLARAYLYTKDWANAGSQASLVLNNSSLFNLVGLDSVFLKNSKEAIWQLQPVNVGWNTEDARTFIIPNGGLNVGNFVYLSTDLINSFEVNDGRRLNWVDSVISSGAIFYFSYKYKNLEVVDTVSEYLMVLRLGEQYLIRAEAEANGAGGGINAAISDLNVIRSRAGLPVYSGGQDQASILNAILHERRVELFTEWGHRWFDLIRTGSVDSVMGSPGNVCNSKGGNWSSYWELYPILISELLFDPNLTQTPGY